MKELYTYTVKKEAQREKKVDNGDGTFTVSTETQYDPISVIVKKPSRKDREEMAMVYNAEFHKCLNHGISTEEMIRRAVLDGGGGFIPKLDQEQLHELYSLINENLLKIQHLKIDGLDASALEKEVEAAYLRIYDIESPQKNIFDHSAENLATRKSLVWAALHLTYTKSGDVYIPVFKGPTFESKLNSYYDLCDEEDQHKFEMRCFDMSYVMVERFLSKAAESDEDFALIEQEIHRFFDKGE